MDYGGYPQPGFAPPPSTFGYTMGAAQYSPYQQEYIQAGGQSYGLGGLGTALGVGAAGLGVGMAGVSTFGDLLEAGGATQSMRNFGRVLSYANPIDWPFRAGFQGIVSGYRFGSNLATGLRMGGMANTAMGIAGGAVGGLGVGAIGAAAAYGLYKGGQFVSSNLYQGGASYVQGQNLAAQFAPSVAPGQTLTPGYSLASTMRGISNSTGFSEDEVARAARELDAQKLFQTTKDMKEFKEKLGTAMKAVKEIASVTKTSIDDAVKMFGDLRAQGFYNTADIQSQSALTQARASITGLGLGTTLAVGGVGTQMARQMGLRGRVGSDLAQRNVTGVSLALRSGALSEEEVTEMGGVEAVGLSQTEAQMRFLSSARGRTMIAGMMGAGGKMDPNRIRKVLSGNMTLEDLVTQTAEGGNLYAAGTRAAKEAAAPYAGMAMVQMAMMQQRQIFGGVSAEGTTRMLGTMGLSREESQALIKTLAALPEQMRKERVEQENQDNRRKAESLSKENSIAFQTARYMRPAEEYLQSTAAGYVGTLQSRYTNFMQDMFGGRTYGFDQKMYEAARADKSLRLTTSAGAVGTPFGLNPTAEAREQYYGISKTASQLGLSEAEIQAQIKSGELMDLGGRNAIDIGKATRTAALNFVGMGLDNFRREGLLSDRRFVRRSDRQYSDTQREIGESSLRFTDEAQSRLNQLAVNQDVRSIALEGTGYMYKLAEGISTLSGGYFSMDSMKAAREDQAIYNIARSSGAISDRVTLDDWRSGRVPGKEKMAAKIRKDFAGSLGTDVVGKPGETVGAIAAGNIQQRLESAVGDSLAATGTGNTSFSQKVATALDYTLGIAPTLTGVGFNYSDLGRGIYKLTGGLVGLADDKQKALQRVLADGKNGVQSLYLEFSKLISKDDLTREESERLMSLKKTLIDAVGSDSIAAQEVEDRYSKAQRPGAEGRDYRKKVRESNSALEEEFKRANFGKVVQATLTETRKIRGTVVDKNIERQIDDLISVTENARTGEEYYSQRSEKLASIAAGLLKSGMGQEKMQNIFEAITEGDTGASILQEVKAIAGGASFEKGDYTPEELEKLKSRDIGKILEVYKGRGAFDTAVSAEGKETVQGTEMEFKKANTIFVQEVNKFVTQMKKSGLVPGEGTGASVNLFGMNLSVGFGGGSDGTTAPGGEKGG